MANLSNINNKFIVTDGGNILIGSTVERGIVTIDQLDVNTVGLVINSTSATYPPYLYLRDQGGAGYSELQANNDLYINCTNVGIGTNSPTQSKLVVIDSADVSKQIVFSDNATYYGSISHNAGTGLNEYRTEATGGHAFYKGTETTPKMTILGDGNVGIGTDLPDGKLHVYKAGGAHNNIYFTGGDIGGTGYDVNVYLNGGANNSEMSINMGIVGNADRDRIKTYQGNMYFRTNDSERLIINSSGNVGIGTTLPTTVLTIRKAIPAAASSYGLQASMVEFKSYYPGYDTETVKSAIYSGVSAQLASQTTKGFMSFWTSSQIDPAAQNLTEKMRIESNGNVGIGTSSPQRPLHVNGTEGAVRFTSTASGNSGFEVGIGTASQAFLWQTENSYMHFATNSVERMRISSLGVVSVGTTSPITDPFVSSNQFQQFQVGKSGVMGSYTTVAQEAMFSNNMYVGSTYNTFQALDTSVNATAMFLYNDYIAFKCGTTAANGIVTALEQMRISNTGELNIGGHGGQFPVLKVVGLAGGVHTGSTWSISANQDGIGRTILGTGGQGRAMYFENDGKTVHTEESSFYKGVYLGGGVAANLLDDYEEGTFYATTNNDGVGAQVISRYTKIGQLVTYTVYFPSWSPTAAGTAIIAGFPFTAITSYGYGVGNVTHSTGVLNCSGGYHAGTAWNGTQNNSTGRSSWVVASARSIMVTGFYYTAS